MQDMQDMFFLAIIWSGVFHPDNGPESYCISLQEFTQIIPEIFLSSPDIYTSTLENSGFVLVP